jgi:hypothetical protein
MGLQIILMGLMVATLLFGFLNLFIRRATLYNFERLHIFLFNLCSGGAILIYYTESQKVLSTKGRLFLILAVIYAVCRVSEKQLQLSRWDFLGRHHY